MPSPRWSKVWGDLTANKTRTLLAVLSIMVGVFAVGMMAGLGDFMSRDMNAAWMETNPPSAQFYVGPPFDDELLQTVRRLPGVGDAEGQRTLPLQIRVGLDDGTEQWKPLLLIARDFDANRIERISPEKGSFPPRRHELVIERASMAASNAQIGDQVLVETQEGKRRELRLAGTARSSYSGPLLNGGYIVGFVTMETMEWLGQSGGMNKLQIVAADQSDDTNHITALARAVRTKVEKGGRTVYETTIPVPGEHPAKPIITGIVMILGVLGVLALGLSTFLAVNTILALLLQQVRQIGVMKAVGARTGQLLAMYLALVLAFGLLALLLALPSSALATYALAQWMASLVNFDLSGFRVPAPMLWTELAAALAAPLLATLWPVFGATRKTVREALSDYGIGNSRGQKGPPYQTRSHAPAFGAGNWIARLFSRPLLLSLRNTFRRKTRLTLTLMTMTLAGAMFISVSNLQLGLGQTIELFMEYNREDIMINSSVGHNYAEVEPIILATPGVVRSESTVMLTGKRIRPDASESNRVIVVGLDPATELSRPALVTGRWLLPEDENAVVVTTNFLRAEPDIRVGDEIRLNVWEKERTWRVVGVVLGLGAGSDAPLTYTNGSYLLRWLNRVGTVGEMRVVTESHEPEFQQRVATELERRLKLAGVRISRIVTNAENRASLAGKFELITNLMLIMPILLAILGGIGLMGTMSMNVMERTRELGVMRAIGASDRAVQQIVIVEGVLVGIVSWLLGNLLALPITQLLDDGVANAIFQGPLPYAFSPSGTAMWLVTVVAISALASLMPAWKASRMSVREVLAYE